MVKSSAIALPGYHITEPLYTGSRTLVYRAVRTDNQLPAVIKLLKNEYPSFSELVQFRNQYTIAKNLEIKGIVKPYSLEPYRNGYALVMEDFGGTSLRHFANDRQIPLEQFWSIALQLVDILHPLHQQRVIHKDIKPANILIQPETQQVKLIDFSISSLLPRETQEIKNPNVLEGTLAYLSPEQTGRMNRGIDYRSDFYSLGVTFFELLTGQQPFESSEPMEVVHCHLAKQPPDACDVNPELPLMLGEIVGKLMAKNAEDRYQSATGLSHDLIGCQQQWQATGKHSWFELGQRDVCDRFLIPEKLYGREEEVQTLLEAFGRVANGAAELMLVAGFSGIGKTAAVNEVHKPIVRWNGYFTKGKFDQFNRNIPLNAFVQAFRDLMGQLLSESDEQLKQWKDKILSAVGENGQVLIEVIPELEQIIGKQPEVPELSGSAAQNRFNLLFQKFIAVFTTLEHPLVMFLDDLQWADSASLNLMQVLLSQREVGYLFIIGAYRDNEVFPAHPLMLTLGELAKAEATVSTLTLKPLSRSDVNHLIADTLSCAIDLALPLTELVYQKTKGNPFFTTQFLKSLHQESYIAFEPQAGYWQCDMVAVRSLSLTDDVVEFMALQLLKLPPATQTMLKLAACIGAQFDLSTLAIVSEQSQTDVATALWKALQEGLILPITETYKFFQGANLEAPAQEIAVPYKFLHDRVQQAAYFLIPNDRKQATHYHIGQLLLQQTLKEARVDRIFELVNQLNYGTALITQQEERDELAQLNLIACRKAKTATAYQAAREYASTGLLLLEKNAWQRQYEISLAFHELAAELAWLCGDLTAMEQFIEIVIEQARSLLEKIDVYRIRIQSSASGNKLTEAIAIAQQLLQQLGVTFPETVTQNDIQQAVAELTQLIKGREIEDLVHLPLMVDKEKIAIVQIIDSISGAAHISGSPLFPLLSVLSVKLSIQYGNTSSSTDGYACYGILACNLFQDVNAGVKFGQLALQVVSKLDAKAIKPQILHVVGLFILHRKSHIKETLPLAREGYAAALEVGNLEYVGYTSHFFCLNSFWCGSPLTTLEQETRAYCNELVKLKQLTTANYCRIYWQPILNLLDLAKHPSQLSGEALQEAEALPLLISAHDSYGLYVFHLYKLMLCYLFGEIESAQNHAVEVSRYFMAGSSTVGEPAFYFYDSLIALAALSSSSEALQRVEQNQTHLQQHWADYAPMNHQHKVDLVAAEKCRVLGQKAEAIEFYDLAISGAKTNEYIQEEALANELAAKFYLDWGKERIAGDYMIEAYYGYARWGAKAKVADLETRYRQLLAPILHQTRTALCVNETVFDTGTVTSTNSSSSVSDSLDLAAILKASQTLSGEIEFDKLLSTLLCTIIQTAGADKCVLMLHSDEGLMVRATAELTASNQIQAIVQPSPVPVQNSCEVPISLIDTVKRSEKPAVITNATVHPQFTADAYIQTRQPKSILCSPILHQGKLLGMVYLENNLATGAFNGNRIELLNLLCSQAAISLENARLYGRSQQYAQQLERSLDRLNTAQSRFHNLVDNVPGVVYQYSMSADAILSLNYISADCYSLCEITPEQAAADANFFDKMVHPDDIASYQQSTADAIQILSPWQWEGRIVTSSGIVKWIHVESRIEQRADGSVVWDGLFLDISDRKLAELAIEQKSQDLEQALKNLQQAQLQIVQSEKMSALGNLVAGVAHEMNNPLGFIAASLAQTQPTLADIVDHLKLYQESLPNPSDEILDHASEIDLDYTLEDLPKVIDAMGMACDRLKNISTSLRTFSRADRDYKVPFNIHEGIDSTILILKHRLKANSQRPAIEVITNYGNLPQVQCFPGQLNQVFMNILANAIDALDESNIGRSFAEIKANTNCITIQTSLADGEVRISIADNGKGMSESVKHKIFDHLFTTKTVGKGTGLGLAIARQIVVEKHGGELVCHSTLGARTEFAILLPLKN